MSRSAEFSFVAERCLRHNIACKSWVHSITAAPNEVSHSSSHDGMLGAGEQLKQIALGSLTRIEISFDDEWPENSTCAGNSYWDSICIIHSRKRTVFYCQTHNSINLSAESVTSLTWLLGHVIYLVPFNLHLCNFFIDSELPSTSSQTSSATSGEKCDVKLEETILYFLSLNFFSATFRATIFIDALPLGKRFKFNQWLRVSAKNT